MAGAMEQRKLPGDAVIAVEMHLDAVAHDRHDHGEMAMHRALRPRGGAGGVDDHREIAVVDLDLGLDLGLALDQFVEILQALRGGLAGKIDRDQVDAALLQRGAAIRLRMQIVVDQRKAHFGMVEDVIHVGGPEHGVDGHPDEAGAMNAEQRFDELDRVVADGRDLLAGLQAARHQIIGKAVGVALELGKGHAPRAVGERLCGPGNRAAARFRRSPIATRPIRPGPGTPPVAVRLRHLNYFLIFSRHCEERSDEAIQLRDSSLECSWRLLRLRSQ